MKRNDFIKKGLLGTGIFASSGLLGQVTDNKIDELKELKYWDSIIYLLKIQK